MDTPESSLIGDVPAQSWLALGLGNLGDSAKRTLEQLKESGVPNIEQGLAQVEQATGASIDQLTNALGDAVLYVQGTNKKSLNGALVIQTKDPDLTGRLLSQLQTLRPARKPGRRRSRSSSAAAARDSRSSIRPRPRSRSSSPSRETSS